MASPSITGSEKVRVITAVTSIVEIPPPDTGNINNGAPFPQLLTTGGGIGTYSINYRNEPIPLRLVDGPNAPKNSTDLAYVFDSILRVDPEMNTQPAGKVNGFDRKFPPLLTPGMQPFDPYTPLLRAYENDNVQVRTLVGAFTNPHDFTIKGVRWLSEPSYPDSGYRNAQKMGISEHFEMLFRLPPASTTAAKPAPPGLPLMAANGATDGPLKGIWGIMRSYDQIQGTPGTGQYLHPLPNNPTGRAPFKIDYEEGFRFAAKDRKKVFNGQHMRSHKPCPSKATPPSPTAPLGLIYNSRNPANLLNDPAAIIFVRSEDLALQHKNGRRFRDGVFDPHFLDKLILRAAAGDWIRVNLTNAVDPTSRLPAALPPTATRDPPGINALPSTFAVPSQVSLQPQLIAYDAAVANGLNVGFNPDATVGPGSTRTFYWYAGILGVGEGGSVKQTPVEFGVTNLGPADTQQQHQHGLYGVLIVEPQGSSWALDTRPLPGGVNGVNNASATVTTSDGSSFREFVVVLSNDVVVTPGKVLLGTVNYSSEPFSVRSNTPGSPPAEGPLPSNSPPGIGYGRGRSNAQVLGDPLTPVFQARAGSRVRFRLAFPGGGSMAMIPVWQLHGHVWQEEPFVAGGTALGNNPLSQYRGMQEIVPYEAYNVLIPSAGGTHRVPGDYLWGPYLWEAANGAWGLLRVTP